VQTYTVRFRHYDPALGRWLERDPLDYEDSMNVFQYVRSAPLNEVDPSGLAGGPVHHPYPLYLGGDPNQTCLQLSDDATHNKAHLHIDDAISKEARRLRIGRVPGESARDFQRRVWQGMSSRQRRSIIRESLRAGGVDDSVIDSHMRGICKNADPGTNRTCQRKRPSGGVYNSRGAKVGGVLGAGGAFIAVFDAQAAASSDPNCQRMRDALKEFTADPTNCDILKSARAAADACFLSIGEALGDGKFPCYALDQWDDLIGLCEVNCRKP